MQLWEVAVYMTNPEEIKRIVRDRTASDKMLLRLTSIEHGFDIMFLIQWLQDFRSHSAIPVICNDGCWMSVELRVPVRYYYLIKRHLQTVYHLKHIHEFNAIQESNSVILTGGQ